MHSIQTSCNALFNRYRSATLLPLRKSRRLAHSQLISPSGQSPNTDSHLQRGHLETTSVVDPFTTSSSHIGQRTLCVLISDTPDVISHPKPTAQWGVFLENYYCVQPSVHSVCRNVSRFAEWRLAIKAHQEKAIINI
jgi:hypothetical protein